jgi:GNAT superfamily N-acetyltransferase
MEQKPKISMRISETEFATKVVSEYLAQNKNSLAMVTLFGGDRIHCCDEVVVAEDQAGRFVGMATIAPDGEMSDCTPTIVGLFVDKEFRGYGFGTEILKATVERMLARGFNTIRIDALSIGAKKAIERLPHGCRSYITISDQSQGIISDMLAM